MHFNHSFPRLLIQSSNELTLNIANGIWVKPTNHIKDKFKGIAEEQFSSVVKPITNGKEISFNNKIEREINQWVANETHGKINHLIDSVRDIEMSKFNS